jgi:hypothetical protein
MRIIVKYMPGNKYCKYQWYAGSDYGVAYTKWGAIWEAHRHFRKTNTPFKPPKTVYEKEL